MPIFALAYEHDPDPDISGDISPERAALSRNGRQVPKNRAPADAMTGAPSCRAGGWDWRGRATVMQIIGSQTSVAKSSIQAHYRQATSYG